eukprot:7455925-Pyramimonas_sp.AAC.1
MTTMLGYEPASRTLHLPLRPPPIARYAGDAARRGERGRGRPRRINNATAGPAGHGRARVGAQFHAMRRR